MLCVSQRAFAFRASDMAGLRGPLLLLLFACFMTAVMAADKADKPDGPASTSVQQENKDDRAKNKRPAAAVLLSDAFEMPTLGKTKMTGSKIDNIKMKKTPVNIFVMGYPSGGPRTSQNSEWEGQSPTSCDLQNIKLIEQEKEIQDLRARLKQIGDITRNVLLPDENNVSKLPQPAMKLEEKLSSPPPNEVVNKYCPVSDIGKKMVTYKSKKYYYHDQSRVTWFTAADMCRQCGLNLVTIETKEEDDFISTGIVASEMYWTSATDLQQEGDFRWNTSAARLEYTNWAPSDPNNGNGNPVDEDCVFIGRWGGAWKVSWLDAPCLWLHFFVCESN